MEKKKRFRPTVAMIKEMERDSGLLLDKISVLEKSNYCMEQELERLRHAQDALAREMGEWRDKYTLLKHRSLWARIFNKEV